MVEDNRFLSIKLLKFEEDFNKILKQLQIMASEARNEGVTPEKIQRFNSYAKTKITNLVNKHF